MGQARSRPSLACSRSGKFATVDEKYFTNGKQRFSKPTAKRQFQFAFAQSKLLENVHVDLVDKLFDEAAVGVFVKRGEVLFKQDMDGQLLFVLVSGTYETQFKHPVTRQSKMTLVANCAIAESCIVNMRTVHEFSLVAKTSGFVLVVHRAQFQLISAFFSNGSVSSGDCGGSFLNTIPLFASLDKTEVYKLEALFIDLEFKQHERIVAPKQCLPGFYWIESGQVCFKASPNSLDNPITTDNMKRDLESKILFPDGEQHAIEWLDKGDYFGQQMLFETESHYSARMGVTVLCSSKHGCKLKCLPRQAWKQYVRNTELPTVMREMNLARLLNRNPAFAVLTELELVQLSKLTATGFKLYEDGEMIIEGGAASAGLFLLEQGAVKMVPFTGLRSSPSYVEYLSRANHLTKSASFGSMRGSFWDFNHDALDTSGMVAVHLSDKKIQGLGTSMDHGAMLASMGMDDVGSVVLLPGETFGQVDPAASNLVSVFSIGRSCVFVVTQDVLFQATHHKHLIPTSTPASMPSSDPVFDQYLDYGRMQKQEVDAQKQSRDQMMIAPLTGMRFPGKRLRVVKRLHETELAWVGVCMHQPSQVFTVVKELNVINANKAGMGQYVLREQIMLAQAGQSNFVAKMTASWEEPERLYLVLELALLGDLRALLYKTKDQPNGAMGKNPVQGELGGFDFPLMQWIAACAALALKHLYEHRILHRDIKPNNLVMDHRGYIKLIDFGISKLLLSTSGSRTMTKVGSPKYMSPELVRLVHFYGKSETYTNAVDWWALGMTMYELAMGKLPFNLAPHMDPYEKIQGYYEATVQLPRSNTSWFESHSWFAPFRKSENAKWRTLGVFVAQLLDPNANMRLGSSSTVRGPRGAMAHKLFDHLPFQEIATHSFDRVPFPGGLKAGVVDVAEVQGNYGKLTTLEQRVIKSATLPSAPLLPPASFKTKPKLLRASTVQPPQTPAVPAVPAPVPATTPTLASVVIAAATNSAPLLATMSSPLAPEPEDSVEAKLRMRLENPSLSGALAEKMTDVFENTDQQQKHAIWAREQYIRKNAFRQGLNLNELDHAENIVENRALVVLQRASTIQALQVLLKGIAGANPQTRRNYYAAVIQSNWRGARERRRRVAM
ncbi:hypothetical protein BASA81_004963 [Batrachochytrium salamandrivorans]|nr:hypothetical protein BASA81_004963 [Batrachochytrium salamandrivorans]